MCPLSFRDPSGELLLATLLFLAIRRIHRRRVSVCRVAKPATKLTSLCGGQVHQWKRCREHVYVACSRIDVIFPPFCLCTAETSKTDNCTTNEVLGRAPRIHSRCIKWRHTPQNDGVKLLYVIQYALHHLRGTGAPG